MRLPTLAAVIANVLAPITPCFMMIVAMWYLRQEQPFRAGCFYCCNGIGSMVGSSPWIFYTNI
jgi:hypothetical protein